MNGAQLHLALNHFPVVLSLVSLVLLLWSWKFKDFEVKRVGLALVVATGLFAGIAYLTGEPAEDVLEKYPSFSKPLVHEHEEAGEAVTIVSILAGISAIASLFFQRRNPNWAKYAFLLTLLFVCMSSIAFLRTAHLGGLIRHEEIRPPV